MDTGEGIQRIDAPTLMRLKSLELRARTILEGFMLGLHRSPFHGSSIEFSEYREYTPGDDPRHIDWKLYARSDRVSIKKYEAETNLRCHLLVDRSPSMSFGSLDYNKSGFVATLAATFSQFLFEQGDAVGAIAFDTVVRDVVPPARRKTQLQSILALLERNPDKGGTDMHSSLSQVIPLAKRPSLLVFFSDLLTHLDGLKKQLGFLASCGHDIVIFHVLDPAERDFSFEGPAEFVDLESGQKLFLDPDAVREQYKKKMEAHTADVKKLCKGLGIDYVEVMTNDSFDQPLHHLLMQRSQIRTRRRRRR